MRTAGRGRRPASLIIGICCFLLGASAVQAQLVPNDHWRTLHTAHFAVHFTPPLEETARRAAANAERAYAALAAELVPPRGTIELVVSDNVDFSNGYATPVPTNRIVIYAHPPVDEPSLRDFDDWSEVVITHELTHVFHLDRTRGWWRVAQHVFGRNPVLFPNLYAPAWVTEGLAVYYESRLTGYGRLAGSQHRMLARSTELAGVVPRLDELSLAAPRFPQGQAAYAYGSLLLDYLARTRGPERVRQFVERSSGQPIPFFLNSAARHSFGVSLERGWREWRDSLRRDSAAVTAGLGGASPLAGWRDLTLGGWYALHPRWEDTATVLYAGNTGRDVPAAYEVPAAGGGRPRRVGRRNGTDVNVALPGGALLYAQLDYTTPYVVRSDLWVQHGGRERRLTRGARLSTPDARRGDGAIVAVQAVPGTTRLVRVSADGRTIAPLTGSSADSVWAEPRWSPDGRRVAAALVARGGGSAIVVLDTAGRVTRVASRSRAVESAPAWSADGTELYFTSDRSGTAELYVVRLEQVAAADGADAAAEPPAPRRVSRAAAGVFEPSPSPDDRLLAAVEFRADGYHVGVAPLPTTPAADTLAANAGGGAPATPAAASGVDVARQSPAASAPPAPRDSSPVRGYSPWRQLLPRYWLPLVGRDDADRLTLGAYTSGNDVVGRHSYGAQISAPPGHLSEADASLAWRYAGLGQPLLDASVAQYWEHDPVFAAAGDARVGTLTRRTRAASLAATLVRPRMRTYSSLTVGASYEARDYASDPAPLIERLPDFYSSKPRYPSLFASAGWSNTRRPALSISPEDGVSLTASARERWRSGAGETAGGRGRTVIGVARAYKSLDLPGYAHHVLALRLAGGAATGAEDELELGGTSGGAVELLPGLALGTGPRTFGVRGFPPDALSGRRAVGGAAEYRAPLTLPGRGFGLFPVFLARTALTAFVEGASAWCPPSVAATCVARDSERRTIASAGAELNVDAALQYDVPYRFRLGVAAPVAGREFFGGGSVAGYFTLGLSF